MTFLIEPIAWLYQDDIYHPSCIVAKLAPPIPVMDHYGEVIGHVVDEIGGLYQFVPGPLQG